MLKRFIGLAAALAMLSMLASAPAFAGKLQKASGTFSVLATQFTPCTTSATNVNFGTADFDNQITTSGAGNGVITLNCGDEQTEVDVGQGSHFNQDPNAPGYRAMTDGSGHYLGYELFSAQASNPNADLNPNSNNIQLPDSRNNNNTDSLTIVGKSAPNADPAEGSYSDLVSYIVYFIQ